MPSAWSNVVGLSHLGHQLSSGKIYILTHFSLGFFEADKAAEFCAISNYPVQLLSAGMGNNCPDFCFFTWTQAVTGSQRDPQTGADRNPLGADEKARLFFQIADRDEHISHIQQFAHECQVAKNDVILKRSKLYNAIWNCSNSGYLALISPRRFYNLQTVSRLTYRPQIVSTVPQTLYPLFHFILELCGRFLCYVRKMAERWDATAWGKWQDSGPWITRYTIYNYLPYRH